jgi:hypothetical protein
LLLLLLLRRPPSESLRVARWPSALS